MSTHVYTGTKDNTVTLQQNFFPEVAANMLSLYQHKGQPIAPAPVSTMLARQVTR